MKEGICTGIGVVGGVIASLFGGWDAALVRSEERRVGKECG